MSNIPTPPTNYGQPGPAYAPPPFAAPATGMATTAMVLGIIACVSCPLVGIVALILGVMSVVRANREPHLYGGKGQAIAGICTGAASLLITPVVLVTILLPSLSPARELEKRSRCATNLTSIGAALHIYANNDPRSSFPDSINTLIAGGNVTPSWLQCPSESTQTSAPDYIYVAGISPSDPPNWIVMYEEPANHFGEGGMALYIDGHAQWHKAAQLKAELERCERERKTRRGNP